MNNEVPKVSPSGRYCVNKAAQELGIARRTLYIYLKHHLIPIHRRTVNGRIFLMGVDIIKFWRQEMDLRHPHYVMRTAAAVEEALEKN